MPSSAQDAFNDHATALRALGAALTLAAAIRYEAAPGSPREGSRGMPNPTLDAVLEPRRAEVGAAITRTTVALWGMTRAVHAHTQALNATVASWSGSPAASAPGPTESLAS